MPLKIRQGILDGFIDGEQPLLRRASGLWHAIDNLNRLYLSQQWRHKNQTQAKAEKCQRGPASGTLEVPQRSPPQFEFIACRSSSKSDVLLTKDVEMVSSDDENPTTFPRFPKIDSHL